MPLFTPAYYHPEGDLAMVSLVEAVKDEKIPG